MVDAGAGRRVIGDHAEILHHADDLVPGTGRLVLRYPVVSAPALVADAPAERVSAVEYLPDKRLVDDHASARRTAAVSGCGQVAGVKPSSRKNRRAENIEVVQCDRGGAHPPVDSRLGRPGVSGLHLDPTR